MVKMEDEMSTVSQTMEQGGGCSPLLAGKKKKEKKKLGVVGRLKSLP